MLDNLQQVFIELTTRTEQKQCASEGIAWSRIPFFCNRMVCMLIESSGRDEFSKKSLVHEPKLTNMRITNLEFLQTWRVL